MELIICLFGTRYSAERDADLEKRLDARLLPVLSKLEGFISFHLYSAADGEALGVIRFKNKAALEAWRDDATHRDVWKHAPELYDHFWIQNCETYREYAWSPLVGRTGENLEARFRHDPANLARPR